MPEKTMRPNQQLQVVTIGPYEDDWAVVDASGAVLYIGHAIYAARVLAKLSSQS